jgi:hypothetical protein
MRGTEPVIRADGSVEIPLTRGAVTVVSAESYGLVCNRLWSAWHNGESEPFYAMSSKGDGGIHRYITGACPGQQVDHANHDTLDNRDSNLRLTDKAGNMRNQRKRRGASQFKGVTWDKVNRRWRAQIQMNGRGYHLGRFDAEAEAALAYDAAARDMFGEFALTNFGDR